MKQKGKGGTGRPRSKRKEQQRASQASLRSVSKRCEAPAPAWAAPLAADAGSLERATLPAGPSDSSGPRSGSSGLVWAPALRSAQQEEDGGLEGQEALQAGTRGSILKLRVSLFKSELLCRGGGCNWSLRSSSGTTKNPHTLDSAQTCQSPRVSSGERCSCLRTSSEGSRSCAAFGGLD